MCAMQWQTKESWRKLKAWSKRSKLSYIRLLLSLDGAIISLTSIRGFFADYKENFFYFLSDLFLLKNTQMIMEMKATTELGHVCKYIKQAVK